MDDFWTLKFEPREKEIKKSTKSELLHIPTPSFFNLSFSEESDSIEKHILHESGEEITIKEIDPTIMKIKRQIDTSKPKPERKKRVLSYIINDYNKQKTKAEIAKEKAENNKKIPCHFYMEGRCKKGSDCPFSHNCAIVKKPELCKYWITGSCIKGEECAYSHVKSEYPCKYYHIYNTCKYGDNCSYSHEAISEEMRLHLKEVYHIDDDTSSKEKSIEN